MDDTGAVTRPLLPEERAIVFGEGSRAQIQQTLRLVAEIDLAHTVMLIEREIVEQRRARDVLLAARSLIQSEFAAIIDREPIRGPYMLYEGALIESAPFAGDIHVGRSRNDINATLFAMRCRQIVAALGNQALRIVRSIIDSTVRDGDTPIPVFTHRRPAMPGTWELYLSAVAEALLRDVEALLGVLKNLSVCPLGAGAGAGSEIPIDMERTASLLGFESTLSNSLDAVASRDGGLRAISAASILGSNLSRLASDFLGWYADHDAITLPDDLVGASSIMPQKRNAFLLEHVTGKAGRIAGACSAALQACHASPFSNAVQVGTEATAPILDGLSIAKDACTLMALIVAGARPVRKRFEELARTGAVGATGLALELRRRHGFTFREAHRKVGEMLRASSTSDPVQEAAEKLGIGDAPRGDSSAMEYGGGAGPSGRRARSERIAELEQAYRTVIEARQSRWDDATAELGRVVDAAISH